MKYLCLVYMEEDALDGLSESEDRALTLECVAFNEDLESAGHYIAAAALKPVSTATTLRSRGGKLSVTDGPFAETREVLGGFVYIEARDLNEALRIAGNIPIARYAAIEVRPVQSFTSSGVRIEEALQAS